MSDLVPAPQGGALTSTAGFGAGGNAAVLERLRGLSSQPAVRKAMPWFVGVAAIGVAALAWSVVSPTPQRTLYSELDDAQRADIAAALEKASIGFSIDNDTGALTVNEEDLYRARMIVASDGALATPESGIELLDNLPLGASRTMEGERLRVARERELMLTIKEIDGVEAVRVHLAEPEHSVFVRDEAPPSASVMMRLAKGRQLSDAQVTAIANLVASSVSGLPVDNVRIVDQNGRLLSDARSNDTNGIELQAQMEEKLRAQVSQLLAPVLGAENFSTEIQVELDLEERTSARESYDKEGVVREEMQESSRSAGVFGGMGVPGAMSNTPPAPGAIQPGAAGSAPPQMAAPIPPSGETRATRSYELGREVAVSNVGPGGIKRISVAVALSADAMKNGKASDVQKIKSLVSAAVGAVPERGDQVEVITRSFAENAIEEPAFYETGWFAMIVRYAAALIGMLLVLLLGVRPILRAIRGRGTRDGGAAVDRVLGNAAAAAPSERAPDAIDRSLLNRQVGAAQKIVEARPDRAVIAIRQMLSQNS